MNERAGAVWARTSLRVWPEEYRLISLPLSLPAEAAALLGGVRSGFAALVLERDLVSLTLPAEVWAWISACRS